MVRLRHLKSALVGGASVLAMVHPAAAKEFDVPGGDLAAALTAYMQQAGVELVYIDNVVQGHRSRGAKGDYTETAALTQLLRGTGFTAQPMPMSNAIGIVPQKATPEERIAQAGPKSPARAPAQAGVETVVVTAQKKEENIQNVPIAVSAFSQQQLTERQIAGGPDLVKEVPNLTFSKTNFSGYNLQIRGIGTQAISVTTDPAVAVAFNDIPFIRNHFFEQEFYDVADAEVLRGPQGTLYGRNATAGVVNIKSAQPTDTYEAMASADFGNFNNQRLEGMLNVPIVGDKLDVRMAGEWTKRSGYTDDQELNTSVDGRDLWSGRLTIGFNPSSDLHTDFVWEHFSEDDDRLRSGKQLCETAQPPTSINTYQGVPIPVPAAGTGGQGGALGYNAQFFSQGCQATSLYAPTAYQVPYGPMLPYIIGLYVTDALNPGINPYAETTQSTNLRDIQSAILPHYQAKNDTLEYNATYNINSALTFTTQTGYNHDFLYSTEDYNRFDTSPGIFKAQNSGEGISCGPGDTVGPVCFEPDPAVPGASIFCDPQLGCSDRLIVQDLDVEHAWQLSQEFRLTSNFSGPFNFSFGANYLHYETEENYYVFSNAFTALAVHSGGGGGGVHGGLGTPNCLFLNNRFISGYQSPNPIVGGGQITQDCIYIDPNPIGSLDNEGHNYYLNQNPYVLNSYAVFGETYYNITNDLKLTTGVRWTVDEKHFTEIPSEVLDSGYGFWDSGAVNQSWSQPTGRAVLDWTPALPFTDQTLLYASAAHGYKAGGANPPGAVFPQSVNTSNGSGEVNVPFVVHPLTFKPEYIEAFELGTKNTLLDDSLTLNGDIFYYNYTGYQISEIVDRTAINTNYNAHVEGAEVSANWEPVPGLKFNFAGGWEDTAAAGGDAAVDLMDRTAGMPGWMVVRPFPTFASNCILPTYVVAALLQERAAPVPADQSGAGSSGCQAAYTENVDPVTTCPYAVSGSNPSETCFLTGFDSALSVPSGYPGFNPQALVNGQSNNDGEGFAKNLAGHALPNAPPFTVSLGGEYSMPVTEDWVATLRSDFYWQADSWARIFNDNPYDRIHGYTNVNLALVLTSANGWQVMGYVKNVFNVTAITGDFLNSDDTGLTTNVFLTDPRLYGVRVTKHLDDGDGFWGEEWSGADIFSDLFADKDNGKPQLWVELGGQMESLAGQGDNYHPAFLAANPTSSILREGTTPQQAEKPPLFSFGEEAKISFQPDDSDWVFAAAVRYGRSGNTLNVHHQTQGVHYSKYQSGHPVTSFNTSGRPEHNCSHGCWTQENFATTQVHHAESHSIIDFMAGKDVGLGMFGLDGSSVLSGGVRVAQFASSSSVDMRARPDLNFAHFHTSSGFRTIVWPYFHSYHAIGSASRKFRGIGPSISWTGSTPVTGNEDSAGFSFDWGANAAVLFGRQKTRVRHQQTGRDWPKSHYTASGSKFPAIGLYQYAYHAPHTQTAGGHVRNRAVVVPNIGGLAGISYRYQNAKISFGYRTDFFFGAIDGGIDKPKSENLGFSGPFATISFGIGG